LLGHGFNIGAPFIKGVPYLSREEEATAIEIEAARRDKFAIEDIHLRSDEVESIRFVQRVREDISKWKSQKTVSYNEPL
jgi:poly(A)-specific ribonuclease